MWKSPLLPDIKPFCLWITLWINKGVIHIIHKSEICRNINLDRDVTYQHVIHSLFTGFGVLIHNINAI